MIRSAGVKKLFYAFLYLFFSKNFLHTPKNENSSFVLLHPPKKTQNSQREIGSDLYYVKHIFFKKGITLDMKRIRVLM